MRPICHACREPIPMQNAEPPWIDAWQTSIFIGGRELRYHARCFDVAFDGDQARLAL